MDTDALLAALEGGKLGGCAMDVSTGFGLGGRRKGSLLALPRLKAGQLETSDSEETWQWLSVAAAGGAKATGASVPGPARGRVGWRD